MSLHDDMVEEDRKTEDDLYNYQPEDRERVLKDFYGRDKKEFGGVDYGDKNKSSSSNTDKPFHILLGLIIVIFFICITSC